MNEKANNCDANAGIGDVKGGPGIRARNVQIEEEKVDHVPMQESIGQIAKNASQKKSKRGAIPRIAGSRPK